MWRRASCSNNCTFLHLDWRQPLTVTPIASSANAPSARSSRQSYVSDVDLIIASDVAYEPSLTQSFFVALRALLLAAAVHAKALVTLERRVNFCVSLCDVVSLDADVFADVSLFSQQHVHILLIIRVSMPRAAAATRKAM
jgi:hypothetical protein